MNGAANGIVKALNDHDLQAGAHEQMVIESVTMQNERELHWLSVRELLLNDHELLANDPELRVNDCELLANDHGPLVNDPELLANVL